MPALFDPLGTILPAWGFLSLAHAAPYGSSSNTFLSPLVARSDNHSATSPNDVYLSQFTPTLGVPQRGETSGARTAYTIVSLLCMLLLASLLGSRAKHLRFNNLRAMNFMRVIVITLYLFAIAFVISAATVESGLGLESASICKTAILVCLVFYVGSKVIMYVFLIERAHALRAPYKTRTKDPLWLSLMLVVFIGFGAIAVIAFLWPIADVSKQDGKCRIGLPFKVTVPLLTYDVGINVALTLLFLYLLRPLLRFGLPPTEPHWRRNVTTVFVKVFRIEQQPPDGNYILNSGMMKAVERLIWKSVIGACFVLLPTIANLALLYNMKGREQGWLCLTMCTLDITWAVMVIHWLTEGEIEVGGGAIEASSSPSGSLTGGGILLPVQHGRTSSTPS